MVQTTAVSATALLRGPAKNAECIKKPFAASDGEKVPQSG